jgi:hypothetical protein
MPTNEDVITLLKQRLAATRARLAALQSEVGAMDAQALRLETALAVLEELPLSESSAAPSPAPNGSAPKAVIPAFNPAPHAPDIVTTMTLKEAAVVVLEDAGGALSVWQIADELIRRGYPYDKGHKRLRNSLGVALDRLKEIGVAEKISAGVYVLAERFRKNKRERTLFTEQ